MSHHCLEDAENYSGQFHSGWSRLKGHSRPNRAGVPIKQTPFVKSMKSKQPRPSDRLVTQCRRPEESGLIRLLLSHLMMIFNHPTTCARVIIPPTNYDLPPKMASLALAGRRITPIWQVENFLRTYRLLAIVKSRFVPCLG